VKLFFCAGAGLSQAAWERLDAVALRAAANRSAS
jgi:feruloyl-CoA synthase